MGNTSITAVRVPPEIRSRIKSLADRESNPQAVVLRRALMLGLDVMDRQAARLVLDDQRREPVAP